MTRTLSISCYGAHVLVSDASAGAVCDRLRELIPPEMADVPVGGEQVRYEVRLEDPGRDGPGGRYRINRDGRPFADADTAMEAAWRLRADVDLTVAVLARDGLFVHAGAVAWRGRGILIPGRSMTGKSTLVAELVRRGATYYSDEFAVLDDAGRLHPYARPVVLRSGPNAERRVTAEQLGGARALEPVPVALIVSTAYQEGAVWRPEVGTGARAVLPIIDNVVLAREEPRRMMKVAAALAPTAVTLAGPRPTAEAVAPAILRYVADLAGAEPGVRRGPGGAAGRAASWGRDRALGPGGQERPARYLRIENFLQSAEVGRLLDYALEREGEFAPSQVNAGAEQRVDAGYRQSKTIHDLEPAWDLFAPRLGPLLPQVRKELGLPWFPLDRIERQLTVHHEGGFFGVHTDNGSPTVADRRLTAIYHFHREPRRFSGGELCLYDAVERNGRRAPASRFTGLEPLNNSVVFFPSDVFHEVRPVRRATAHFADSRFAVTMWFWAGPLPDRF